jgi:hypothetical protein
MTLCIAAECEYRDRHAIAYCADWRAQTGDIEQPELMTGSDDTRKILEFREATVLLSGKHSKAVELATACKTVIREFTETQTTYEDLDIAVDCFMKKLRQVAATRKTEMIHNFVENNIGLPHSEFVKLPRDQHFDVWTAILKMNLGADILITYVSHEPIFIRLDRFGQTHWEHNYGVIGDGADIARAMLCLQTWTPAIQHGASDSYGRGTIPVEECLFRISEAHFAAHKANPSSVGEVTSFHVSTPHYRGSVKGDFLSYIHTLLRAKHRVPQIQPCRDKDQLFSKYRSFATGEIVSSEPIELVVR